MQNHAFAVNEKLNPWRRFYQVHITLRCGIRHVPFTSGNSLECLAYAFGAPREPTTHDRIEVRSHHGERLVQTIWTSPQREDAA